MSHNSVIQSNNLDLQEILDAVNALPEAGSGSGGVVLPELDNEGTAADLLAGKELIDGSGNVVTGTIPTKIFSDLTASGATVTVPAGYYDSNVTKSVATATQVTPSISVNSSGLITASATQTAGYVESGTKSATKQLTTQAAKTVTPTKSSQTAVASGVYTTGAVTVGAIPSEYITTTDATATAANILTGKTAYVKGSKVTGTMANNGSMSKTMDGINTKSVSIPAGYTSGGTVSLDSTIDDEVNDQADLIAQIKTAVDNLPAAGSGGGSVETCTVTVINNLFDGGIGTTDEDERLWNSMIAYTDASSNVIINYLPISSVDPSEPGFVPTIHTYTVLKGTIMYAPYGIYSSSDNPLEDIYNCSRCIIINNDCTAYVG